jgi:hypothetical protein
MIAKSMTNIPCFNRDGGRFSQNVSLPYITLAVEFANPNNTLAVEFTERFEHATRS